MTGRRGGISIHSPHARGDGGGTAVFCPPNYFNPLPSCEGRPAVDDLSLFIFAFQSTPLMRGETRAGSERLPWAKHFNPLPSCEGRHFSGLALPAGSTLISIHSPHARGDLANAVCIIALIISIHSPHARGDPQSFERLFADLISIHSPHARGDRLRKDVKLLGHISIHSPHARGD